MVLRYKALLVHAFDNYKTMKIIYSMYRAGEVSVHRACCERATQPCSLGGGGTIYPGWRSTGVTTRRPRKQTVFTRLMLIEMYLPFHGLCLYICTLYLQSVSFMQTFITCILFSFSNCINVFVWHNNCIRKHEYAFITTITIQFGECFQSYLSSSDILKLNTLIFKFTYFDVRTRLSIFDLRLLSDRRTILVGKGPLLALISSPGEVLVWMNIWEFFIPMNHLKQLSQCE